MQFKCIFTSQPSVTEVIGKLQGADNQLSTELSKSATHNIWLLIYKALTSLQPAKTAEKNLCCLLKRTYQQMIYNCFFCFGDKIYDDMPLLN